MANEQRNLSEQMQLLYEVQYTSALPHLADSIQYYNTDTGREARLLDTFSLALTTGKPGDIFAATFDKRGQMQLVLAKNGPPTPDDIAASTELISLIGSPAISDAMDLFPFLIRRCGANIDKRIRNVHTSIQGLQTDFLLALEEYVPETVAAEFPSAADLLAEHKGDAFSTIWGDFVQELADITAEGLNAEDVSFSIRRYALIYLLAGALMRSRFLSTLIDDENFLNRDRTWKATKLKRRLDKVCHYVSGISLLIQKAKRLFPIPHRWVTDTFTGTGEGVIKPCNNVYDVVSRALDGRALAPEIMLKLDNRFPSMLEDWKKQKTVRTCIHAEIRIILHLGLPSAIEHLVHPIGLNKRSCLCCTVWIAAYNKMFETGWKTSRNYGKPFANWALPGAACPYAIQAGRSLVDEATSDAVLRQLNYVLVECLRKDSGKKRSADDNSGWGWYSSE
ncbi:hypothetical protein M413DRAFT_444814 [Hebeloma cylindrosporum]|uniref:Uncharacterized protein n=1 Tax=Hebeloma cylindrosporum TaxID=76867 RepID=A0A0C3CFJ2_HEBCY|nr:hypothetical protein M413DRAFT_444814 [Hebeloma cylindrosporum h7]